MSVTTTADEQQIRQVMDDWRRHTAQGNVDGLLTLLADDVIFLTPGNPPITKKDFAAGFRQVSAKARIESTQEVRDLRVSGDIAYVWSHLRGVDPQGWRQAGGELGTRADRLPEVTVRPMAAGTRRQPHGGRRQPRPSLGPGTQT